MKSIQETISYYKKYSTAEALNEYYKKILGGKYYTGQKFGKLTAKEPFRQNGKWWYKCECECGNVRNIKLYDLPNLKHPMCTKCSAKKRQNTYDLSGDYGKGWDANGNVFYFDLEDYDKIKNITWHKEKNGYFSGREKSTRAKVYMGQIICGAKVRYITDRPNDNRKNNIENCIN